MSVKKAIITAGGYGTRFLPATKAQPKEMLPVVDKPAIQYLVEEALASGIEDIIIVTYRGKNAIVDHFDKAYELEAELMKTKKEHKLKEIQNISEMAEICYVRQKQAFGLGHAVYAARKFVGNEPFAVMLADDIVQSASPCISQLIEIFNRYKTSIIGVESVPEEKISFYGIIKGKTIEKRLLKIESLLEKPHTSEAPSNLAIVGRYILHPDIFEILRNTKPGVGGEIQLTDALLKLNEIQQVYAYIFEGTRYDVGDKFGYLKATVDFALQQEDLKESFKQYLLHVAGKLTDQGKRVSQKSE